MTWHAPPRWLGRLWPRKIRLRLALLYAGLFLATGSALLALTYGLVAASLPDPGPVAGGLDKAQAQVKFGPACKQADAKARSMCIEAFASGAMTGAESQRQRTLHSLLIYSLLGLGLITAAAGGLGWYVSGRVLLPVRAITGTARRAAEGHLGERLALSGPDDELKELADTFDDMLQRLDATFAAQRRFVANASHELRTPLTVMRTAIDVTLAKPERTSRQLEDMAARVRRSIDGAQRMIDAMLTLAVSDQGAPRQEPIDLSVLAEEAVEFAAADIDRLRLRVDAQLLTAPARGDPQLLERMIWNLVDNAVQHNQPGGWISLRTGANDGTAFLAIANSGTLVRDDALPALLEPFQRLSGRGGGRPGVGLGLSIARSVSAAHAASLTVRARPSGGLEVIVTLSPSDPRP
jgi:signal transduction histidine kinase